MQRPTSYSWDHGGVAIVHVFVFGLFFDIDVYKCNCILFKDKWCN